MGSDENRAACLSPAERRRYARQIVLPGVGLTGQARLKSARVTVVGAGGLGSPALSYLAAAGIGQLRVIDPDIVEEDNLQRQLLYGQGDVGQLKVDAAARRLVELNPHTRIRRIPAQLTRINAPELLRGSDVVIDGTDNFPARYAISDACVAASIPCVWAALGQFDAQLTVFWAGNGPCYRCVFPIPPEFGAVPNCSQAGIFGALCGIVGAAQASEALKLLTKTGTPLLGRMAIHDARSASWAQVSVRADPLCPSCGQPRPEDLRHPPEPPGKQSEITPTELAEVLGRANRPCLIDLRSEAERSAGMLPGARAISPDILNAAANSALAIARAELLPDRSAEAILYCASGVRSALAVSSLVQAGYRQVRHLAGGWQAWAARL